MSDPPNAKRARVESPDMLPHTFVKAYTTRGDRNRHYWAILNCWCEERLMVGSLTGIINRNLKLRAFQAIIDYRNKHHLPVSFRSPSSLLKEEYIIIEACDLPIEAHNMKYALNIHLGLRPDTEFCQLIYARCSRFYDKAPYFDDIHHVSLYFKDNTGSRDFVWTKTGRCNDTYTGYWCQRMFW